MFMVRSGVFCFCLVILLFSSTSYATAQESASSSPSLSPETQKYILEAVFNLNQKIEATANRLENIGSRIKSRTTLIKEAGVKTDEVWPPLVQGTYLASEVKRILPETDVLAKEMVSAEKPYATHPGMINNTYNIIKGLLLDSHSELLKALSALKSLDVTTATSTDSAITTSSTTTSI